MSLEGIQKTFIKMATEATGEHDPVQAGRFEHAARLCDYDSVKKVYKPDRAGMEQYAYDTIFAASLISAVP